MATLMSTPQDVLWRNKKSIHMFKLKTISIWLYSCAFDQNLCLIFESLGP